ncbi:phage tail protein [Paenibacillus cisolokensis]|uniref:tail protein X n=1 Tax=Paenibacillus cisolokensis TaxID=1658519 RepID=UPI003D2A9216
MPEYVTIQGDTWDGISYKLYGDDSQTANLMQLNPEHMRTVIFGAGVVLRTQEVPPQTASDLPPWRSIV